MTLTEDTLTIGFDPEFELQKELVTTPKNSELLQAKIREITHKSIKVKVVSADDPLIPQGDEPLKSTEPVNSFSSETGRKFEDDPLIHKALEIFKGQIVEIRR